MLLSRQLRLALLISLLWHLFLVSLVSVIFLPSGLTHQDYASVYFLGPILRNPPSFAQLQANEKKDSQESFSPVDIRMRQRFALPLPATGFSESSLATSRVKREIFNTNNIVDVDNLLGTERMFAQSLVCADDQAQEREIIFKPPVPAYPEWVQKHEQAGSVIFKVHISADGLVEGVTNVQGSASPEIDASLARYVKRWRFAPVSEQRTPSSQTVRLNLNFDQEKIIIAVE